MKQQAVLVGLKGGDSKHTSGLCLLEKDPQRGWSLPRVQVNGNASEALTDLYQLMAGWDTGLTIIKSTGFDGLSAVDDRLSGEIGLSFDGHTTIYRLRFSGFIHTASPDIGKGKLLFVDVRQRNSFITDELTTLVFAHLAQHLIRTQKVLATARR